MGGGADAWKEFASGSFSSIIGELEADEGSSVFPRKVCGGGDSLSEPMGTFIGDTSAGVALLTTGSDDSREPD
jgi:hypothetical protein